MPFDDTAIVPLKYPAADFEQLYNSLRQQEQRLYTNEQLLRLPDIDVSHIHYREWKIRKHSAMRLINYLEKKEKPLKILEIGCGNGWLANKLSELEYTNVIGLDINKIETDQAKRVFKKGNLQFFCEDFDSDNFQADPFDVIVFAASVQYFSPLTEILNNALSCLARDGEIHLTDTNFYTPLNVNGAVQRTHNYYAKMGCPQLAGYYFHHCIDDLKDFNYKVLANPNSIINKLQNNNPFYWICINQHNI